MRLRPRLPVQSVAVPHGVENECVWLSDEFLFASCACDNHNVGYRAHCRHVACVWRHPHCIESVVSSWRVDAPRVCPARAHLVDTPLSCRENQPGSVGQPRKAATSKATAHSWCRFVHKHSFSGRITYCANGVTYCANGVTYCANGAEFHNAQLGYPIDAGSKHHTCPVWTELWLREIAAGKAAFQGDEIQLMRHKLQGTCGTTVGRDERTPPSKT